jgi:hypothetical protein
VQPGERPPPVTNAVRLMFLRVGIGLISIIVLFATKNDLKKQLLKNNVNATDSTVNAAIAVGAVIGIVFLVLYALLAVKVSKGKKLGAHRHLGARRAGHPVRSHRTRLPCARSEPDPQHPRSAHRRRDRRAVGSAGEQPLLQTDPLSPAPADLVVVAAVARMLQFVADGGLRDLLG